MGRVETYLTIVLGVIWFVKYSEIPQIIQRVKFVFWKNPRLRPFDCEKCLSFWLSLIVDHSCIWSIAYAGIVSLFTIIASRLISHVADR